MTGANLTKLSHIHLVLKCGYCAAIVKLCAVVAWCDVFRGACEDIATSVPGLLEMFVWTPSRPPFNSAG